MNRLKIAASLALATFALLGLVHPAAAQVQVPLLGQVAGSVVRVPLTPPFVLDTFTMTGNATQLGQYKLVISATVNLEKKTASGTYLFVASNGDKLAATFTGSSMPTATPGIILIVETGNITGGTGRFAGATGGFICQRLFNPATSQTVGSLSGTISVPGP